MTFRFTYKTHSLAFAALLVASLIALALYPPHVLAGGGGDGGGGSDSGEAAASPGPADCMAAAEALGATAAEAASMSAADCGGCSDAGPGGSQGASASSGAGTGSGSQGGDDSASGGGSGGSGGGNNDGGNTTGGDASGGGNEGGGYSESSYYAESSYIPPNPELSLTAQPSRVISGNSTTLSWSSQDADSCSLAGPNFSASGTSGSQSTGPITSQSIYTLTCENTGGSVSASVTVSLAPSFEEI